MLTIHPLRSAQHLALFKGGYYLVHHFPKREGGVLPGIPAAVSGVNCLSLGTSQQVEMGAVKLR